MYCVFAAVEGGGGGGGGDRKYGYSLCFEEENTCPMLSKLIQNIHFRCFTAAHTYKTHTMENELFFWWLLPLVSFG